MLSVIIPTEGVEQPAVATLAALVPGAAAGVVREVLLVDDILESGLTLSFARKLLLERGAKHVSICTLLDKPGKRLTQIEADFVGFPCGDEFLVGYGLDWAHRFRGLPYIGVVEKTAA